MPLLFRSLQRYDALPIDPRYHASNGFLAKILILLTRVDVFIPYNENEDFPSMHEVY